MQQSHVWIVSYSVLYLFACIHIVILYIYAQASSQAVATKLLITEYIVQRVSKTAMSTYYNNAEQIMQAIGNGGKLVKMSHVQQLATCVPSYMDCHKLSFKYLIPYSQLLLGGLYTVFMPMRTAKKPW